MTRNATCAASRAIRHLPGPKAVRALNQFGPAAKPGQPIRLFLDDARNPPLREKGWVVVRTVKDGIMLMMEYGNLVEEVSLDNDLGKDPEGIRLLEWIIAVDRHNIFPLLKAITIHTGNMRRGRQMQRILRASRYNVKRVDANERVYPRASEDTRYIKPYS